MITTTGRIHHVSAISSDAQKTVDFYATFLGLRLVKQTVNFDDPNTYHLYFGDHIGQPGTLMTFFPWPGADRGRRGAGQVTRISLSIPEHALAFWVERLTTANLAYTFGSRFRERSIDFQDPDGLELSLVATDTGDPPPSWPNASVGPDHAVRGIHSATLWVDAIGPTMSLLTGRLSYEAAGTEDRTTRLTHPSEGLGQHIEIRDTGGFWPGAIGSGVVHHIAFRADTDAAQERIREELVAEGLHPTPVLDRKYFRSVYFREPGHALFEIATDPPGFEVDESLDDLGRHLTLPSQHESMRDAIERALPTLTIDRTRTKRVGDGDASEFVHRMLSKPGAKRVILALHGTGGDENDIIPLAEELDAEATILSPRGRVKEGTQLRFFARYPDGTFDQDSLAREAHALASFVKRSRARYGLEGLPLIALGYSNGANIAAALLMRDPDLLDGAILLRGMVPFEPEEAPDLHNVPVLLSSGIEDATIPRHASDALEHVLWKAGANISIHRADGGHALTENDVTAARAWLDNLSLHT